MDIKALADEKNLLHKINNAIPNSVYIFDFNQRNLVWMNDRVRELYGYTLEELRAMGKEFYAITMHPDDIPVLEQGIQDAQKLRDGEILELEYRFKDRDGRYHWLNDRLTVFSRDAQGNVESVLGVALNVDVQMAYKESQKRTIEKLNLSLGAAHMGTFEWDFVTNKTVWDPRMYEIHGAPMDYNINPVEIIYKYMHKEDAEITSLKFREAVAKREDIYVTYRMRYPNNEIHHIRCYGRCLSSPEDTKMYGVAWDSTEEIKTEKEIEESRARLISNTKMAALGEMSGGIAHEINNPLTVIQARAFQLAQMVDNNKADPEKIKQAAESISRTADKIARIIKSLRSFSREGSNDPFDLVPVDNIIQETLEFCRTRFYNHGVEIEAPKADPELEIECRVVQLEQVLLNLLNNSFDAIQKIETKWIRVEVEAADNHVDIRVVDSGDGIPDSDVEHIMMPFFTTKEVGKGTGLGLSISSGIMRSHHGELFLDRKAANTTFVIRIPRLQPEI